MLGFLLPLIGLYHHFAATSPYTDSNTIQVNLIGGGVVTNLEIVIGINGLALPNARGFAAEKRSLVNIVKINFINKHLNHHGCYFTLKFCFCLLTP